MNPLLGTMAAVDAGLLCGAADQQMAGWSGHAPAIPVRPPGAPYVATCLPLRQGSVVEQTRCAGRHLGLMATQEQQRSACSRRLLMIWHSRSRLMAARGRAGAGQPADEVAQQLGFPLRPRLQAVSRGEAPRGVLTILEDGLPQGGLLLAAGCGVDQLPAVLADQRGRRRANKPKDRPLHLPPARRRRRATPPRPAPRPGFRRQTSFGSPSPRRRWEGGRPGKRRRGG